jgi:hypothetical protein
MIFALNSAPPILIVKYRFEKPEIFRDSYDRTAHFEESGRSIGK